MTPQSTMREVLEVCPGAQRALFRRYHIGGCSSCAFHPEETLEQLCARNGALNPDEVIDHLQRSQHEDNKVLITARELASQLQAGDTIRLVDIRTREEWNAIHLPNALLLGQPVMQEILGHWPRETPIVIYDHQGRQSLDAAAFFAGHGFTHVRCLAGGIDAWSREVDREVPRYRLEATA
jgi:rhodanese-related sulfurtransferase